MDNKEKLLKTATQFDVHKWSDYPEVTNVVKAIFGEIFALRSSKDIRIRNAGMVERSLRVVLIDLWAANTLSLNPYRAISKNKSDYQKDSRYRQIFLKYDYLIPVINDLCELGYLEEKLGYRFIGHSRRTRIKATDKLINKILTPEYGFGELIDNQGALSILKAANNSETIILKDANGDLVEYRDTNSTTLMRENVSKFNDKLSKTKITLRISDEQHKALQERISNEYSDRLTIDFTSINLHRVFNNSSWKEGGRFYGGWWQNIPKELRKHIEINRKETVEVDYSGHHIRILYAKKGLLPPDDPYDLEGFGRDIQKQTLLIMINAETRTSAIRAIVKDVIRPPFPIMEELEKRHAEIKEYFFTGAGLWLMYEDSILTERIMLLMLERGAAVLPVHDSFIVRTSYEEELQEVMEIAFEEIYGKKASLKTKKTVLLEESERKESLREAGKKIEDFITTDLTELLSKTSNNYKWFINMWGS